MVKLIYFIFACMLLLTGCVTTHLYGTDFNMNDARTIENNVTTKADIIKTFGEPYTKEIKKSGLEIWNYIHIKTDTDIITKKDKVHTKNLIIAIQNSVVIKFDYSEKFENK